MKTKRTVLSSLTLASIVLLLAFSSCQNNSEQPNPELSSEGTGFFKFSLDEVTLGRTILPSTPTASNFTVFKLEFLSNSVVVKTVEWSKANLSDSIKLDVGTYELHVTAYLDTGKTKPAAWGSKTDIKINNGQTTTAGVELAGITNTGQGTFKYTITYPTSTSTASMKITPINGTRGTEQTNALTSGATISLPLNAGYYRVVFTLRDNNADKGAERWEILHIYQNMESTFTFNFVADHFQSYDIKVTNGNNSGTGSLRQAIADVPYGGTIIVNSSVKTIQLSSTIAIAAGKSFALEGNGVTIQASQKNGVLYLDSSAVVTIRSVHFTKIVGRVLDNSGNLSLESCIFSNNVNNENYETIIMHSSGTLVVIGSTFYKNFGITSGVISLQKYGVAVFMGNLFYGNTNAGNIHPIVIPNSGSAVSFGYNVVDVPLGTNLGQSGWSFYSIYGHSTDKVSRSPLIAPATFEPLTDSAARNVFGTLPDFGLSDGPTKDFYGNPIPTANAAAGAVQVTGSGPGYLVNLSVNDSKLGGSVITSSHTLTPDGFYTGDGTITFNATSTGPTGYGLQYWQVNDTQYNNNPLTLPLTNYNIQAVFGRNSPSCVRRVLFSGPTENVTLNSLSNNDIYLVKVNTSNIVVNALNTGGPLGSTLSIASGNVLPAPDDDTPKVRMGHPLADEYNANHPPFERRKTQKTDGPLSASAVPTSPSLGDTALFWVESSYGNKTWEQKKATLKAQGTYGNVWVMDDLDTYTDAQAQAMAIKFDQIYPIETSLLSNNFGGWDVGSRIQILVYDIGFNQSGIMGGFFWGKDMYRDYGPGFNRSNEAAMFYINGNVTAQEVLGANRFYSILVHEFQHMIHFAQKSGSGNSESWYNEMLSMITEDVISPLIDIGPTVSGHPIRSRIPSFLNSYYLAGITEWGSSGNTLDSYAIDYAFGAYLLRNYGGAALLKEIFTNNSTNIESVTAALRTVNGNSLLSFEEAVRRFGEAMIFTPTASSEVQSFNKTDTRNVNGYTYTATGFNVWGGFSNYGYYGPKIFGSNEQVDLRPYSLTVHQGSAANWKNQSGNITITLQRPNDLNVEYYLMVK